MVGTLFPRAVGAALSQLVKLLGSSLDGAQKVCAGLRLKKQAVSYWMLQGKLCQVHDNCDVDQPDNACSD